jgi:hypothetical protein
MGVGAGEHLPDQSFRIVRAPAGVAARNRREAAPPQFRQPLFYKIVRHPLYLLLLAFWATLGHILTAICCWQLACRSICGSQFATRSATSFDCLEAMAKTIAHGLNADALPSQAGVTILSR